MTLFKGRPERASLLRIAVFLLVTAFAVRPAPRGGAGFAFSSVAVEGNTLIEAATIAALADIPRGENGFGSRVGRPPQRVQASGFFQSVEFVPPGQPVS